MKGATVSITMGGTDITETAYSDKTITISEVTDNIVINITAIAIVGPQWIETTNPPTSAYYSRLSPSTDVIYATDIKDTRTSTDSNVIAKSLDGVSWENITVANSALYDGYSVSEPFVFGDNGIVIYPSSAYYVSYSNTSNITSWTRVSVGTGNAYQKLTSAFYGGGKFVLTYNGGNSGSGYECMIFTSSNGQTWTKYAIPNTNYNTYLFGAYLNDTHYVFVSNGISTGDNVFYTSKDGLNWTEHESTVIFPLVNVDSLTPIVRSPAIYADNKYIIKTKTGSIYSTNGTDWINTGPAREALCPIVYFNGMFISTDSISENGINWTSTDSEISIYDLAVFNDKLIGISGIPTTFYYATE